jgi:hypothetical protein
MNEDRFVSENAWYHFVLDDVTDAIRLYGWEVVQKDIIERYNFRTLEAIRNEG